MTNRFILFMFSCFVLATSCSAQQKEEHKSKVHWVTLNEALELQKTKPKKIMIDMYTKWCGPCRMMSQNTFEDDEVANYLNENYYAVKFDAEGPDSVMLHNKVFVNPEYNPNSAGRNGTHQLTIYLNVQAYPTLVFLDETATYLAPIAGYRTPPQLELFLKFFSQNLYKTIQTQEQWQQYEQTFQPTWQ